MPDSSTFELNQVFGAIAAGAVMQQQRLDAEYLRDLNAFEACFRQVGYSSLAREFVPARQVLQQLEVECSLGVRRTKENTFAIRLGNRVVSSRYLHSQGFDTQVQVTIRVTTLEKQSEARSQR